MKERALLEVYNLKQYFPIESGFIFKRQIGAVRAVDDISFTVRKGETLGIVGESGCGKSTAIRSIAQLYKPTAGEVYFDGIDLINAPTHRLLDARKNIQMIFQDPYASLNPRMTVRTIISEPLEIYRKRGMLDPGWDRHSIENHVEELMERVGLNRAFKNRYPHEFSGGQRQRIGIARALALNPKIILADEPVSALDVSIQSQILNLLH
ncbi:MAG: ATP-binding cassette domain-containing protein, partial [Sphaerochaetaceae bacterium]